MEHTQQKAALTKLQNAVIPDLTDTAVKSSEDEQIHHLPLKQIVAKLQVRSVFNKKFLEGMIASIVAVGLLQPIRVRREGDVFVIVDGEQRYRSVWELGWDTIPSIIERGDLSESMVIQKQLISNCSRDDLNPIDKAIGISKLIKITGWSASETAAKLGMSNATVSRLLALLTLPESIQERVCSGEIPANSGYELLDIKDADLQQELAEEIASRRMTRDELKAMVKARNKPATNSSSRSPGRVTAPLGEGRAVTIVGAPNVEGAINILEELLVKLRKARPQGVSLGTFVQMLKDNSQAS